MEWEINDKSNYKIKKYKYTILITVRRLINIDKYEYGVKMMNIIFLDFDGVINNNDDLITEESILTLKKIIHEYQAKVVVISSWIMDGREERKIRDFLDKLGIHNIDFINPNLIGTFENNELNYRFLGIADYLLNNPQINYLILDDEYDDEYNRLNLNHLKTNMDTGLVLSDYNKVAFKKPDLFILSQISIQENDLNRNKRVY